MSTRQADGELNWARKTFIGGEVCPRSIIARGRRKIKAWIYLNVHFINRWLYSRKESVKPLQLEDFLTGLAHELRPSSQSQQSSSRSSSCGGGALRRVPSSMISDQRQNGSKRKSSNRDGSSSVTTREQMQREASLLIHNSFSQECNRRNHFSSDVTKWMKHENHQSVGNATVLILVESAWWAQVCKK